MRAVSSESKFFLNEYRSQSQKLLVEDVDFFAGAALTLLVPTLVYCAVSGQFWLLYLMACNWVLGTVLGFIMFKRSSAGYLSCISLTVPRMLRVVQAPSG